MSTDLELLHRYVEEASEDAFTEIVRRHVNMVYGAALRQLSGNASLAEDVTQAVFTALALRRKEILQIQHLTAWLYATTRFTVSHTVRAERRRQGREQKAQVMHALMMETESHEQLALPPGLIDDVLAALDERDREVVLLRFFEDQPFAAIGSALELSEDAVLMRVSRALEKIRELFARKGIKSTAAAISALFAQQVVAAPAHLAAGVAATALAGTAAIVATTAGTKLGFITFMTATKTAWLAGAVAALSLGYAGYQYRENVQGRDALAHVTHERETLRDQLSQSDRRAALSAERALRAEQLQSELQQKLDVALVAKAKPQPVPQKVSDSEAEKRAVRDKKMAQMKPLLAAGMPIRGAVVVTNDGKAVSHPVELVIGKETIVESDDGSYSFTPSLNPDGSVTYRIALMNQTKDSENKITKKSEVLCKATSVPWEGFLLKADNGAVMALEPDLREP